MRATSTRRHRQQRYTAVLRIKLDAEAFATLETLRTAVRRLPTQVLRQVIAWGLQQEERWRVDRRQVRNPARAMPLRLEPEVRSRVHAAANAAGGDASTWACHILQHVMLADLPPHWQAGGRDPHAHDSRHYGKRSMMRLDDRTWEKLEALSDHCDVSVAEVIRHLVAQAKIEDFPQNWQVRDGRQRAAPTRRRSR